MGEYLAPYHDTEWGAFTMDDRAHFEHLSLEGFQSGLSWTTILKKRGHLNRIFADFDPAAVAEFDENSVEKILQDPGGIRNRRKVNSVLNNARRVLEIQEREGSFGGFLFEAFGGKVVVNRFTKDSEIPPHTEKSTRLAKILKKEGFSFVGPTTVYAHLQSMGFVNDHLTSCFRRQMIIDALTVPWTET
ncbi:MAG: DNA-3-methyladenine glycosylase I [Deltaproteobacteria bacterium]|nr:DNA-3-methyladenine glycosylase I [Candidatus Zymogenaceae bacterium]